jgi:hypothetical protein
VQESEDAKREWNAAKKQMRDSRVSPVVLRVTDWLQLLELFYV